VVEHFYEIVVFFIMNLLIFPLLIIKMVIVPCGMFLEAARLMFQSLAAFFIHYLFRYEL